MKKLITTALAATALLGSAAQAATVSQQFDVKVTLDAVCRIVGAPIAKPVLDFGTYTAFGSAATPAPTQTFAIECTRNLAAPTFDIDGTAASAGTPFYGVLAGLNYSVTPSESVTTAGTAATAVAGGTGSADVRTVTLTGAMAAGQAGDCAGVNQTACNTVATNTHTLTITY